MDAIPPDELRRQLRLQGVADEAIDQMLRTGGAPLGDGTGHQLVLRTQTGSGFAPPGSQARATLVLTATAAVIVAIVLAFVFG